MCQNFRKPPFVFWCKKMKYWFKISLSTILSLFIIIAYFFIVFVFEFSWKLNNWNSEKFICFYFHCGCLLVICACLWWFDSGLWQFVIICWWFVIACCCLLLVCGHLWSKPVLETTPWNSWYSFDQPQKDEKLRWPWSHPVILKMRPLDWE